MMDISGGDGPRWPPVAPAVISFIDWLWLSLCRAALKDSICHTSRCPGLVCSHFRGLRCRPAAREPKRFSFSAAGHAHTASLDETWKPIRQRRGHAGIR